ncbi:MAG: cation diffusion facilitator family transporter [Nitrososphaeraceae archaeon]
MLIHYIIKNLDEPYAVDVRGKNVASSLTALKNNENKKRGNSNVIKNKSNLIEEGLLAGQKIAKISIVTLLSIGLVEILVGYLGGSVVALADGIDSISDAMISFIVLLGLRIAHRPPNKKFPFGYHKVETLAALIASIGMIVIGSIIFYHSYQALIHPHEIKQPYITMIVLASASIISLHRAFQMRKIANKYNLLSLKTDAKNSIKDGSASVIGFFSVLIATQFGVLQMDAIGGMVIAGYIFSVAYISLKRSSFILIDSCDNSNLSEKIHKFIEEKFDNDIAEVKSVLVHSTGIATKVEINVAINGMKQFNEVDMLLINIKIAVQSTFDNITKITMIPHSVSSEFIQVEKKPLSPRANIKNKFSRQFKIDQLKN